MRAIAPEAGIRFETICATPAFLARADDPAVLLAGRLAEADATTLVAFGTEAGLFQNAGIPTVVCGPGHIAQAHQADEYGSLAQLAASEWSCRAWRRWTPGRSAPPRSDPARHAPEGSPAARNARRLRRGRLRERRMIKSGTRPCRTTPPRPCSVECARRRPCLDTWPRF
jgi:hypothetical protein